MAVVAAGLNRPGPFILFGALLALVLPGYALSVVVLPELGRVERVLCSLGLSFAIDVLSGFLLNLTPLGLSAAPWAGWLGFVTLALVGIAWRRRAPHPAGASLRWLRLSFRSKLAFAGALLTLLLAVKTAQLDSGGPGSTFTQLWALPRHAPNGPELQIGVRNGEGTIEGYSLVVEMNGECLQRLQDVELGPEGEWSTQVGLPPDSVGTLRVLLYRAAEPDEAYRTVQVQLGEGTTEPATPAPAVDETPSPAVGSAAVTTVTSDASP